MDNSYTRASAKKRIRRYLVKGGWIPKVSAWLFGLAAVITFGIGTVIAMSAKNNDAKPFDPVNCSSGEYVYLDVAGVSNWLYKVSNGSNSTAYYAARDKYGALYIITADKDEYMQMAVQQSQWENGGARTHRIYGCAYTIGGELRDVLVRSYDGSGADFDKDFGTLYLKSGVRPLDNTRDMWYIFALLTGIFWLCAFFSGRVMNGEADKSIKALAKSGELEQAAAELDSPDNVVIGMDGGAGVLTENYIFARTGSVLRYDDILWFYIKTVGNEDIGFRFLTANTAYRRNISALGFGMFGTPENIRQVVERISEKSPDALVGESPENLKEYKKLRTQRRLADRM